MSDFQKLLDQALEKVNLTPVDDTPEMEAVGAALRCIPGEHQQN